MTACFRMLQNYLLDGTYFLKALLPLVLSMDLCVHCVSMELNHVSIFLISIAVCDYKCVTQDAFAKQR